MLANNLRKRLASWLLPPSDTQGLVPHLVKDLRQYERFLLLQTNISWLLLENALKLAVVNVGYGGFAAVASSAASIESLTAGTYEGEFHFLDQHVKVQAQMLRRHDDKLGFCFTHKDSHILIFLREILEHMRYGGSLHVIKKEFLKDAYQGPEWHSLRGEGPTDILLKVDGQGKAEEFLCTFRSGEHYQEFRLRAGQFTTGRSIDKEGVSSRIASTAEIDRDILRSAMQILLGITDLQIVAMLEPVLSFGLRKLGL